MAGITDIFRFALKKYIAKQNIKQSEIADGLGIDRPAFNAFLRGKKNFSLDRQEKIANHIGYDYIDIINSYRENEVEILANSSSNKPITHSSPEHEALIDEAAIENDVIQPVDLDLTERRLLKMYNALDAKHKQLIMNMLTDIFISFYRSD
jgi:transcriptional regulator with XRE-family HTH domain